jgi:hypothetical protein
MQICKLHLFKYVLNTTGEMILGDFGVRRRRVRGRHQREQQRVQQLGQRRARGAQQRASPISGHVSGFAYLGRISSSGTGFVFWARIYGRS